MTGTSEAHMLDGPRHAALLIIIAILTAAARASVPPTIAAAAVAAFAGRSLTISGAGFGEPARASALVVTRGRDARRIPSSAGEITSWSDRQIVVRLPANARSGRFRVETAAGASRDVRLEIYQYDWFDIPPTPGTNALPLALARAADGTLWINQEFHLDLQRFDPATRRVSAIPIPRPAMPGPFALSMLGTDIRTQISGAGEDVILDPGGHVWFTQGGGYLYSGKHANHSRVVRYDQRRQSRIASVSTTCRATGTR